MSKTKSVIKCQNATRVKNLKQSYTFEHYDIYIYICMNHDEESLSKNHFLTNIKSSS